MSARKKSRRRGLRINVKAALTNASREEIERDARVASAAKQFHEAMRRMRDDAAMAEVQKLIAEECDAVREMLLAKNRAYGNSALSPMRVFSRTSTEEQIRVRLDDKLSRLARGNADGEDVEKDLMGYIVLMRVHRRMHRATNERT